MLKKILRVTKLQQIACTLLAAIILIGLFPISTFASELYEINDETSVYMLYPEHNFDQNVSEMEPSDEELYDINDELFDYPPYSEEGFEDIFDQNVSSNQSIAPLNYTFTAVVGYVGPNNTFAPWGWLNDDSTTRTAVVGGGNIQALPLVGGNYPATGPWDAAHRANIETIIFTEPVIGRPHLHSLFRGLPNLTTIENIDYIDLTSTIWLSQMFRSAGNLTTITGLDDWDVTGVLRFSGMFRYTNFTTLDLSNWNLSSATRLDSMFRGTPYLTAVAGVATWDTRSVEWMSWMFMNATGFTSLDLTNLDTSSTERMASMFQGASNLTEIIGINTWNTGNLETIEDMFRGASRLTSLDLSNWDTSSVGTNPNAATTWGMRSAFRDMERLEGLNLEGWDTRHLTGLQMELMFSGSNALRVLTLGENWTAQGTPNQQGLVTPSGPEYTGYWVNVGTGTIIAPQGDQRLTPAQLMTGIAGRGLNGTGETWVWERAQLTVTFTAGANGTLIPAPPQSVSIPAGRTLSEAGISVPAPAPNTGYEFVYWTSPQYPGATFTSSDILAWPIVQSTTFTAAFAPVSVDTIEVTFVLSGGNVSGVPYDVLREILAGEPITTAQVPVPTRPGWSLLGWKENGSAPLLSRTDVGELIVTAPRTFVAQWQPSNNSGNPWMPGPNPPDEPWVPGPNLPTRQAYLIGVGNGLILQNANITRAEVATILFRLITDEARAAYWMQDNPFSDVTLQNWFNNAVATMTNAGVLTGLPDGTFAPNQTITRAEMTALIVRFVENMDGMILLESRFNDVSGHWAEGYINVATANGWVPEILTRDCAFHPDRPLTRAEAAAMINRVSGRLIEHTEDLLPNMRTWSDNADVSAWYYSYIQSATNSYSFLWRGVDSAFERWVAIIPARDWSVLERPDSKPEDILHS